MPVSIRPATPDDLPALGRLGALLVRTHHDFDPKRFMAASAQTESGYASFLGSQLEMSDVAVLVADDEGTVIGYAYTAVEGRDYMSLRGPAAVLHDIIVEPDRRRGGVGRRLLQAAIDFARGHGAPRMVLSTATRNAAAQRLFEEAGFRSTMIEMTVELD